MDWQRLKTSPWTRGAVAGVVAGTPLGVVMDLQGSTGQYGSLASAAMIVAAGVFAWAGFVSAAASPARWRNAARFLPTMAVLFVVAAITPSGFQPGQFAAGTELWKIPFGFAAAVVIFLLGTWPMQALFAMGWLARTMRDKKQSQTEPSTHASITDHGAE